MTKTKRQWYEASTGNHQGLIIEEDTGENIAVSYDKADARLIAAAPDLLAAAMAFVKSIDSHSQDYELDTKEHGLAVCLNTHKGDLLRAAIAKAI